jgi:hypothetical protein
MPRPSKPAQVTAALPNMAALEVLERACEDAASKWNEVSKATRLDYEAKARRLAAPGGYPFHAVTPATRKLYKAAGLWVLRKQVRSILREARRAKKGATGKELFAVRVEMWRAKLEQARHLLDQIDTLSAVDCNQVSGIDRAQPSHKQKPATDADLGKFHAWAAEHSSFAEAFIVAEFSGCRGEELGKGIRIEAVNINNAPVLRFHIESAKCDGDKKGLDIRCVEVPYPALAADDVKRRWKTLAKKACQRRSGHVVTIEATDKTTAGDRFSDACRTASRGSGVKVGAYSFRQRFSAQVKASSAGTPDAAVNVALALGHQTTETQQHYARAHRGKGGISPVSIRGVNVMGAQIRGPKVRTGPPLHVKTRHVLQTTTPAAPLSVRATARRL